jgi:hypothetical protein
MIHDMGEHADSPLAGWFSSTWTTSTSSQRLKCQTVTAIMDLRHLLTFQAVVEQGSFLRAGLGVAIVPVVGASPPPAGTVLREVQGVDLGLPVGLLRRPDGGPPSRAAGTYFLIVPASATCCASWTVSSSWL